MESIEFEGELQDIKISRLISETKEDQVSLFFLVLGIFYNDLKSLTFYRIHLDNEFEGISEDTASMKFGEREGMRSHLNRLLMATVHEFFKFIERNAEVTTKMEFKNLYNDLNKDLRERWDLINRIAKGEDEDGETIFAKILLVIRNNNAFHYYQTSKVLRDGFIQNFYKDEKNFANSKCYYSIGEVMKDTRFYYCDAASDRSIRNQIEKYVDYPEFASNLNQVISHINFVVMTLLKKYLKQRPY